MESLIKKLTNKSFAYTACLLSRGLDTKDNYLKGAW